MKKEKYAKWNVFFDNSINSQFILKYLNENKFLVHFVWWSNYLSMKNKNSFFLSFFFWKLSMINQICFWIKIIFPLQSNLNIMMIDNKYMLYNLLIHYIDHFYNQHFDNEIDIDIHWYPLIHCNQNFDENMKIHHFDIYLFKTKESAWLNWNFLFCSKKKNWIEQIICFNYFDILVLLLKLNI